MSSLAQSLRRARAIVPVAVSDRFEYYNILAFNMKEARSLALASAAIDFPDEPLAAAEQEVRWVS